MFTFDFSYLDLLGTQPSYVSPAATDIDTQLTAGMTFVVSPTWFKNLTLQWTIPAEWGSCVFNIYKANSQTGPFTKINDQPVVSNGYVDPDRETAYFDNYDYYILEVIKQDGTVYKTLPLTWYNQQATPVYLMAKEINRREWLLLNIRTGIETYVFRRKNFGKRCPLCWDDITQGVDRDDCPNCFGTGWDGGYWGPAQTLVQYDATSDHLLKTYFGNYQPDEIAGWTIAIPNITPRDLIVRWPERRLYSVKDVTNTELQGTTVRQILRLDELNRTAPEFQILSRIIDK